MPGFIDDTINSIKNGIVDVNDAIGDWIYNRREPNRTRPRIEAVDPSSKIDKADDSKILNFPHDRPKYFISFAFEEYVRPTQFEGLSSAGLKDYITLPIPANLRDSNHLRYNEIESGFLLDAITKTVQDQGDAFMQGGVTGMLNSLSGSGVQLGEAGVGLQVRRATDVVKQGLSLAGMEGRYHGMLQLGGLADNPFNTVAFQGPNFKQHHFVWRLSPRSESESTTIKDIVNTLKKAAHPELLSAMTGGFYKYPMIIWPKFNPDKAREYLYNFKPCVITDINVNYAPNDRPGFYANTEAPAEVIIELNLQEIELWRNGDGSSIVNQKGTGNILPRIKTGDFNDVDSPPVRHLGPV